MNRLSVKFALVLVLPFILTSCDDDQDEVTIFEEENSSFYALEVGNKWVYQHYRLNIDGSIRDTIAIEEIEVIEEVTIDEKQYAQLQISTNILMGTTCATCELEPFVVTSVRDSLGFLVTDTGDLLYSSRNTEPYIYSEADWGTTFGQLQQNVTIRTVSAGNFSVLNNMWFVISPDGEEYEGRVFDYYSEGIGQIELIMSGVLRNTPSARKELIEYQLSSE